jgi:hypothetical protein
VGRFDASATFQWWENIARRHYEAQVHLVQSDPNTEAETGSPYIGLGHQASLWIVHKEPRSGLHLRHEFGHGIR